MKRLAAMLLAWAGLTAAAAQDPAARVEALLAADRAPEGVVFEIMAWEDRSWDWAAPQLTTHVRDLRTRFPGLDIALVSHGAELFELTRDAGLAATPALRELADLHGAEVAIHVCGEYAQWKRLEQRDFLPFVDVAASGVAQIENYVALGFVRIPLEAPHAPD